METNSLDSLRLYKEVLDKQIECLEAELCTLNNELRILHSEYAEKLLVIEESYNNLFEHTLHGTYATVYSNLQRYEACTKSTYTHEYTKLLKNITQYKDQTSKLRRKSCGLDKLLITATALKNKILDKKTQREMDDRFCVSNSN